MNIQEINSAKEKLQSIKKDIESKLEELQLIEISTKDQEKQIVKAADQLDKGISDLINRDNFIKFFEKPYASVPIKNGLLVAVPKFIKNFQVGWLFKETDTFFIYQVNQYSKWLGDIPSDLLDNIQTAEPLKSEILNGQLFFSPKDKEKIKERFKNHLSEFKENSAKIIRGHEFNLIVDMVESGTLPFKPRKVLLEDLRAPQSSIKLREYQLPAYSKFLEVGAIGLFHPTGAGKSMVALSILDVLNGNKIIFVPSRSLVEQWHYYLETYCPHIKNEIEICTYQGYRQDNKEYVLAIFDECHKLPANTFSRLALLNTKYRIGLSASPHREDGREAYIFALTGFPVGLNWQEYMKTQNKKYHPINVYITDKKEAKVIELLNKNKKTFIFSDSLEIGERLSKKLGVPFIYGDTKDRLEIIRNSPVCVVSRVADMGISIKDLEHIIEVDFLYGSRQQELQRTGRLMHSEAENTKHDILMTNYELSSYGKRLWSLQEKGFQIKIIEEDK